MPNHGLQYLLGFALGILIVFIIVLLALGFVFGRTAANHCVFPRSGFALRRLATNLLALPIPRLLPRHGFRVVPLLVPFIVTKLIAPKHMPVMPDIAELKLRRLWRSLTHGGGLLGRVGVEGAVRQAKGLFVSRVPFVTHSDELSGDDFRLDPFVMDIEDFHGGSTEALSSDDDGFSGFWDVHFR